MPMAMTITIALTNILQKSLQVRLEDVGCSRCRLRGGPNNEKLGIGPVLPLIALGAVPGGMSDLFLAIVLHPHKSRGVSNAWYDRVPFSKKNECEAGQSKEAQPR